MSVQDFVPTLSSKFLVELQQQIFFTEQEPFTNQEKNLEIASIMLKVYISNLIQNTLEPHMQSFYRNLIKKLLKQLGNPQAKHMQLDQADYEPVEESTNSKLFQKINQFKKELSRLFNQGKRSFNERASRNKAGAVIEGMIDLLDSAEFPGILNRYNITQMNLSRSSEVSQKVNKLCQTQAQKESLANFPHFKLEKIGFKQQSSPYEFSSVSPSLHKNYITEISAAYQKIAPIRIKQVVQPLFKSTEQIHKIDTRDCFTCDSENMKICYLKPNTNILAYYHLQDINQANVLTCGKEYYRETRLQMKWLFSNQTKSVITSCGKIFVVGCQNSKEHLDQNMYEIIGDKMAKRGVLPQATRNPGFITLGSNLYYLTGKTLRITKRGECVEEHSKKCYKYSIKNKKWTEIQECNAPVTKPTLSTFDSRFIFKIGGLNEFNYLSKSIQMYDTVSNKWTIVRASLKDIRQEVEMLQNALAVQINADSIYVFGGINTNKFSVDTGFLLRINEIVESRKQSVKVTAQLENINNGKRNIFSLSGIYDQSNAIVQNNCIYTLRVDYTPSLL